MIRLDCTEATPEANLALDEALLESAEAGEIGEALRFWESPMYFVVVGLTQQVDTVVERNVCEEDGIPILRRCSAGGCVLQGPGCLNYTLILNTVERPGLSTIRASYDWILSRVAGALGKLDVTASPAGISDIAIDAMKISGNAQRRKRRYFLHHGTLLHGFNLALLPRYLKEPTDRPDYRDARIHTDFVRNLSIDPVACRQQLAEVFDANDLLAEVPIPTKQGKTALISEKYSRDSWNYRH